MPLWRNVMALKYLRVDLNRTDMFREASEYVARLGTDLPA